MLFHTMSGLVSQLRRAAVSVTANIAEGAGRTSLNEVLRFLSIAQGSASEVATEMLIAQRLGYCSQQDYAKARDTLDSIGRMIYGLTQNLKKRANT